jgi:hypothetical protein
MLYRGWGWNLFLEIVVGMGRYASLNQIELPLVRRKGVIISK